MHTNNEAQPSPNESSRAGGREIILISSSSLTPVRQHQSLRQYAHGLWERRHFIRADARSKAFRSGQDTILGKAWIVLDPLLQVLLYSIVFGVILKTSKGIDNFVGFLIIGVVFFGILSRGITLGSGLVQKSKNMISTFDFPVASVVFSAVGRHMYDNVAPATVAVGVALLTQLNHRVSWTIIAVVPLFFLLHVFALGTTFFVARLTAFVPDLQKLVALFVRGLFFISGIFFTIDRFAEASKLHTIVKLNPAYQFLMAVRTCVLNGEMPSLFTWSYLTVWSSSLAFFGFIYFWRAEQRYATIS